MNLFNNKNMRNFNKIFAIAVLSVITFSCVEDDDFNIPETAPQDVQIEGTFITLNALYSGMVQDDYISTFDSTSDAYTVGYVVSSDEGGNFFEELLVQDSPEDPTRGARVSIDASPLFTKYNVGRKVFIKLAGLSITTNTEPEFDNFGNIQNGELLGMNIGKGSTVGRVEQIGAFQEESVFVRADEVAAIIYNEIEITDLNASNIYTAVKLTDVQFDRRQLDLTLAGEASDSFDGDRTLISCSSNATALFQTSTFADFKSLNIPDGRGFINAVVATDFFGENYTLSVNTPDNIVLTDTNRCDPSFLECTTPGAGGSTVIFDVDFETVSNQSALDAQGFINENVSGGSERYEFGSFSSNSYLSINAFGQSDDPMIAWLVLPGIDLDATINEALEFAIQSNFDQGGLLEVFISNNFTGDVTTTTWSQLDASIPAGPSNSFASSFSNVPAINISCVDGTDVRIAFKYTASDPQGTTTRYHIDNISVTGN